MSQVHWFQRYSQKENVVTNNTLLLLRHLYQYDPLRFEALLMNLFDFPDEDRIQIGVSFEQQKKGSSSVLDGSILQPSLGLFLETKLGSEADIGQLERHLEGFAGEEHRLILVLVGKEPSDSFRDKVRKSISAYGDGSALGRVATFRELVQVVRESVDENEVEILEVVDDYEDWAADEGLLPRDDVRMRAVACGDTLEDNERFGLYWEPEKRATREYRFLGFYKDKAIRGLGEIANRVTGHLEGDELIVDESSNPVSDDERARIRGAIDERPGLAEGFNFILVKAFVPTEFRATNSFIRSMKYFHLDEYIHWDAKDLWTAEEIAEELRSETW